MSRSRIIAFAVLVASLGSGAANARSQDDILSYLSTYLPSCSHDGECIVVDTIPCGCAMGGRQVAINARYRKLWSDLGRDFTKSSPAVACPALYSCIAHPKAACVANSCTVRWSISGPLLPPG